MMGGAWPTHLSEPAGRFLEAAITLDGFLGFTRHLAERLDQIGEATRKARLGSSRVSSEEKQDLEARPTTAAQAALNEWDDVIAELEYSRVVDNYLAYLAELLALIFRTRPETMRSEQQVSLRVVLDHDSMGDLIATLAERQVERYSRDGFRKLHDELSKSMGFALFTEDDALNAAARAVEIRNLLVHKRGVVDARFLRQVPNEPIEVGQHLVLDESDAAFAASLFVAAVRDTDVRAVEKWGLPRPCETADYMDLTEKNPAPKWHF